MFYYIKISLYIYKYPESAEIAYCRNYEFLTNTKPLKCFPVSAVFLPDGMFHVKHF